MHEVENWVWLKHLFSQSQFVSESKLVFFFFFSHFFSSPVTMTDPSHFFFFFFFLFLALKCGAASQIIPEQGVQGAYSGLISPA